MAEVLDTLVTILTNGWIAANTSSRTPTIARRDTVKRIDTGYKDYVYVYRTSPTVNKRNAFGYTSVDVDDFASIELWTSYSDAQSVLMKDEIKRIINGVRVNETTTGFTLIEPARENDFRDNFRKVYRWVLDFELKKYNQQIAT